MNRRLLISACALLFAACAWPSPVRADPVNWTYATTSGGVVPATTGSGSIVLTGTQMPFSATGDSNVVLASVQAVSSALPGSPAVFTNATYNLTIALTDVDTNQQGQLTFDGAFNGTLTGTSANVGNTYTNPTTQSVTLGLHKYTVTIGPYVPPGPPNSPLLGSFGANVTIETLTDSTGNPDGGPVTHPTPEPSSMLLAGLGGSALLLMRFRRKRTNPPPA